MKKFNRESKFSRRRETERHRVTCDKCGKKCEVPFKPTKGKPVHCDQCFKKHGPDAKNKERSAKEFEQINRKLDKILEMLESD